MMRGSRCTDGSIIARSSAHPYASIGLLFAILWEDIPPRRSLFHLLYWNNSERLVDTSRIERGGFDPLRTSFDHLLSGIVSCYRKYPPRIFASKELSDGIPNDVRIDEHDSVNVLILSLCSIMSFVSILLSFWEIEMTWSVTRSRKLKRVIIKNVTVTIVSYLSRRYLYVRYLLILKKYD